VAFGSEAEVLPAGSATTGSTPFRADSKQIACRRLILTAPIDQPDAHRKVVMIGGVLAAHSCLHR